MVGIVSVSLTLALLTIVAVFFILEISTLSDLIHFFQLQIEFNRLSQ